MAATLPDADRRFWLIVELNYHARHAVKAALALVADLLGCGR